MVALTGFAVSRVVYYAMGVRFDASPLDNYLQYLDPLLLRQDLLRSVYHLHSQPPIFNLFLGVILKLFPDPRAAFHWIHLAFGLIQTACITASLLRLGVRPWLAAGSTLVFVSAPSALLYENWLFYSYLTVTLLSVAFYFLLRYLDEKKTRDAAVLFAAMAILVLERSTFNALWFILFFALILFGARPRRRPILLAGVFPLLLILAFQAKSWLVFHTLSTGDAYLKLNLAAMATRGLPDTAKRQLIADGHLPVSYLVPLKTPVGPLEAYYQFVPERPSTGIPALDNELKSNGFVNFNHLAYLDIAADLGRGIWTLLRTHPECYAGHLAFSTESALIHPINAKYGCARVVPELYLERLTQRFQEREKHL